MIIVLPCYTILWALTRKSPPSCKFRDTAPQALVSETDGVTRRGLLVERSTGAVLPPANGAATKEAPRSAASRLAASRRSRLSRLRSSLSLANSASGCSSQSRIWRNFSSRSFSGTFSPLGSSKTQTSLVPTPGKVLGQFFSARAHTMIE
jgi:hypothetical protein